MNIKEMLDKVIWDIQLKSWSNPLIRCHACNCLIDYYELAWEHNFKRFHDKCLTFCIGNYRDECVRINAPSFHKLILKHNRNELAEKRRQNFLANIK